MLESYESDYTFLYVYFVLLASPISTESHEGFKSGTV